LAQWANKNLNGSIPNNEIEIEPLKNNSTCPDGFTTEFYQTFKQEETPMLLKLFYKVQKEGLLPNSLYKASII
jgi:hypothetical protein